MASQVWIKSASLQVSSGAVSFICSSTLAYMIKFKRNGLQTPYRRLIFAISISDMMQSISLAVGPFLNNKLESQAFWAIGNQHTCSMDGLVFALGNTATPMYSCFLTIYYYCKLYKKMYNQRFARNVELWINVSILTFLLVTNIYALGTNSFNSSTEGQFCLYAVTPAGCRQQPDLFGECENSPDPDSIAILNILTSVFIPVACLIVSVMILSFLLWKILLNEKIFRVVKSDQEKNLPQESISAQDVESEECASSPRSKSTKSHTHKSRISERLSNVKHRSLVRFAENSSLRTRSGSNIDDSTGTTSKAYRPPARWAAR